jgi:hypothetical protein
VEDVDVGHPFSLEVAIEFLAPLVEEGVAGFQQDVGLLLALQFLVEEVLFELVGSLVVSDLALKLVDVAFELEDSPFEVGYLIVEGVLFFSVGVL